MTTDRELLELAAKAAGIKPGTWFDGWNDEGRETGDHWNPLISNGDAFTLMVTLRLEPRFIDNSHSGGAEPSRVTLHLVRGIVENIEVDVLAATRRAIVRAAAQIGRNME